MFVIAWLLSLIGPRVALVYLWAFTSWIDRAFDSWLIALAGFMVLPWSTLAYVSIRQIDGFDVLRWMVVGVAFVVDIGGYASSVLRSR